MKRIAFLSLVLIPCLLTFSCKKNGEDDVTKDPAQLSVVVKDAQATFEVPEHQTVILNLSVAADPKPSEAYTITLAANPGLVKTYNTSHGTDYAMLPSAAFSFTTTQVMLPKFSEKSTNCELRLKGEGVDADKVYLLPVVIDGVQGGTNFQAPDEKAAYILFKMLGSEQEGDGSEAHPYEVNDVESFLAIGSMLQDDATTHFSITADIDLTGVVTAEKPWTPFNFAPDNDAQATCRARRIVIKGNNHTISNFTADGPLFAILCGSVTDLTLENFNIDSDACDAATLIGVAGSGSDPDDFVLRNVHVTNSVVMTQDSDSGRAGGLVARMRNGLVENCSTACKVEATKRAGGLIGYVDSGTIKNSFATGNVTTVTYYGGGLVGFADGITVIGCYATGNVTSEGGNYSRGGGLIGQIEGDSIIEKCYATGNVSGQGHFGGGLIGAISSAELDKDKKIYEDVNVTISECYATGTVEMPHGDSGNWSHAGGLLGSVTASTGSDVTISNCYSTGAILIRRYSGGFVGSIYDKYRACRKLTITNSYTTSDITGIVVSDRCGLVLGMNSGADSTPPSTIVCTGFVAWNTSERAFSYNDCVSTEGNYYGTEGTVSQQAKKLGWDENIWDLSGSLPKLKNVQ